MSEVEAAQNVKIFWYCGLGDIFQTGMGDWADATEGVKPIVIRIAGPVASGKSEVIRELTSLPSMIVRVKGVRDFSIPAIKGVNTAAIGAGMEFSGTHEHPTELLYDGQMTSRNNLERFLVDLPDSTATTDVVQQMLEAAGLSENEERRWGSHRLPVVRRLSVECSNSVICQPTLYYFDLPGELWSLQRAERTIEYQASLGGAQHAMIAIDGALLTGDLDESLLRESMRPQDSMDVGKQQSERRDNLRTFLRELCQVGGDWDPMNSLPIAFVITKADMIRAALRKRESDKNPLLAWLDPRRMSGDDEAAVESLLTDCVKALSGLADEIQTNRLRCSEGVTDLLGRNNPDLVELRADYLRGIARVILEHFAEPSIFWELVRAPIGPSTQIPGLRLVMEDEDSYWRGVTDGCRVQCRDLINTVIGAALMKNLDVDVSPIHIDSRQVRYFVTCCREIIKADGSLDEHAQGCIPSTGIHTIQMHLISRAVQAAMRNPHDN